MAALFHFLLCCSVWLTSALALVPSPSSPATNRTDLSPSTNTSSTRGSQTLLDDPFTSLITSRVAELERLYQPDVLRLCRVRAVCSDGESTDPGEFAFLGIKAWLPTRGLFVNTINAPTDPSDWGPATESPPRSRGERPRRGLWDWAERRPLKLADAFDKLKGYEVLRPFTRVSIVKFERSISWGPDSQPYWFFESDLGGNVLMGAHDELIYTPSATDLRDLTLDDDEAGGDIKSPGSAATS